MQMKKLLLLYTGGTIGMVQDQKGILVPFDFNNITENVPELSRLDYQVVVISFDPILDSSNMNMDTWIEMASIIEKNYQDYDGFVILHGSDTMAYTASALSFMLENLAKPVILTGSQLPIGEIRTDAKENLITALEIAAAKDEHGQAIVNEVCIYFDYKLFRGNRSKKTEANKFEAFSSPNFPILAEAGVHINFNSEVLMPRSEAAFVVHKKLKNPISLLKIFPGISPAYLQAVISAEGVKAIILEGFGAGNTCTDSWFVESLQQAVASGILILEITQCIGGNVEIGRYETSKHLAKMGVVGGLDLTFEAAITKLMFLFGQELSLNEIASQLTQNLRGEITA
jgi:L-asparaginase